MGKGARAGAVNSSNVMEKETFRGDIDRVRDSDRDGQGLRHVFGIGGTGTVGAQLETRPTTHLPRKIRFSSDFVYFILGNLGKIKNKR